MSTAETLQLIKSLKPKLGEKAATELVTYIEEYKHDNLATKTDLKELEINLRKEINANVWKIVGSIGLLLSIFVALIKLMG